MSKLKLVLLPLMAIVMSSFDVSSGQKAIIELRQASLEQAFKKIETAFRVQFTYDPQVIVTDRKIDLPKKERTLSEVLNQLTGMTGLQFMQIGKLVGVQKVNIALPTQKAIDPPITINGVVRDNDGNPLPGVTVNVRGKSRSVEMNESAK
jgi:hypothetical protein